MRNEMKLEFIASPANEGMARVAVASFMTSLNPTLEEVEDVKTAVSEAVSNCIIHGYGMPEEGRFDSGLAEGNSRIYITCTTKGKELQVEIRDYGVGIADIKKAMEPLYTSKPELERSGMGFAFMEAFMDQLFVESTPGKGTCVRMIKNLADTKMQSVWE